MFGGKGNIFLKCLYTFVLSLILNFFLTSVNFATKKNFLATESKIFWTNSCISPN